MSILGINGALAGVTIYRQDTENSYKRSKFYRAGKSMNGGDVVIAPNILEQMANDTEKAVYYEGKIDDLCICYL